MTAQSPSGVVPDHNETAESVVLTHDVAVTVVVDHDAGTVTVTANGQLAGVVPVTGQCHETTVEVCVFNARDWSHETWRAPASAPSGRVPATNPGSPDRQRN